MTTLKRVRYPFNEEEPDNTETSTDALHFKSRPQSGFPTDSTVSRRRHGSSKSFHSNSSAVMFPLSPSLSQFYNTDGKRVSSAQMRQEYFERRERCLSAVFHTRESANSFVQRMNSASISRRTMSTPQRLKSASFVSSRPPSSSFGGGHLPVSPEPREGTSAGRSSYFQSTFGEDQPELSTVRSRSASARRQGPWALRPQSSVLQSYQKRFNRALTAHVTHQDLAKRHVEQKRRIRSAMEQHRLSYLRGELVVSNFEGEGNEKPVEDANENQPPGDSEVVEPTIVIEEVKETESEQNVKETPAQPPVSSTDALQAETSQEPRKKSTDGGKQQFGLRFAVADFAKKVKDNEGMGISTFSYLDESTPQEEQAEEDAPEEEEETPEKRKLSERFSVSTVTFNKDLTPVGKLRRGVKTIILITKAITTKTEQTRKTNRKYLTFADVEDEVHSNTIQMSLAFSFDASYFKARKEKTLSSDAVQVFRVHPQLRTEEMIRVANSAMNNTVEAFSEFPQDMQRSLVQRGYYETFGPKRVIIRQGHAALNFYFIISGVTMVSVGRQNKATGETYGETVAFLKKGNSFGELALMYGGKRSATVSCKTDVELLAVSRDDFIDIFMNLNTETEPDHIVFLRQVSVLKRWPINELPYDDPSICMFTYFRRGTVLSRDSNTSDWIYVIKTGHCRIIKDVPLDANTKDTLFQTTITQESAYHQFLHNQSLFGSTKGKRNRLVKLSPSASEGDKPPTVRLKGKVYIQIRILGPGDTFGLEPVAYEILGGTTSMTLVSDGAECIGINKAFFKRFVNEPYLKWLRKELQAFPAMSDLQSKLNDYYDWDAYRQLLVDGIGRYKDGLSNTIHI